jgi:DNA-directed RNA polymerase beta' subunit
MPPTILSRTLPPQQVSRHSEKPQSLRRNACSAYTTPRGATVNAEGLRQLIGREPVMLRDYLEANLSAFEPSDTGSSSQT